jgi:NTP pyrophosphatase (non-canonical NTP hydrolase)
MYLMYSLTLDDMGREIHELAVEKGFWDVIKDAPQEQVDIFITKQLMMIVSEAVEVMEAIRKSHGPEAVADEMADIVIRTLDLYAGLKELEYVNTPLQVALNNKTSINKSRPQKHGVKF